MKSHGQHGFSDQLSFEGIMREYHSSLPQLGYLLFTLSLTFHLLLELKGACY